MIHDLKASADRPRFQDESRRRSPEVRRAFTSVIQAASQGAQSEVSGPAEVSLEPDDAISDAQFVRGVD